MSMLIYFDILILYTYVDIYIYIILMPTQIEKIRSHSNSDDVFFLLTFLGLLLRSMMVAQWRAFCF